LDQSSQHSAILTEGKSETLQVYLAHQGVWYLWAYSCAGTIDISIEDTTNTLVVSSKPLTLQPGEQYLYKTSVPTNGMRIIKVARNDKSNDNAEFFLSSSHFNDPRTYDFEPKSANLPIEHEYIYSSMSSVLSVKVKKMDLRDFDATDKVMYQVRVCPYDEERPTDPQNMCNLKDDCRFYHQEYRVNDQKDLQAKFEKLPDGIYYIQATANLEHMDKLVRFVPYEVSIINIKQPLTNKISNMIGKIIIGLAALIVSIVICIKCYKKIQVIGEDRGFELPTFGKKKGYDYLGESF